MRPATQIDPASLSGRDRPVGDLLDLFAFDQDLDAVDQRIVVRVEQPPVMKQE